MNLTEHQYNIFKSRYALPYEESWGECVERVANHIVKAEENGKVVETKKDFISIMENMDFIPGGRILYGSGRKSGAMLNCFVLDVEDNRQSIAKFMSDMYLISVAGGGLGSNYSKIRPKGASIQGMKGMAPGVVSEIRKIDAIGEQVKCGGERRTALLACLSVTHPDIMEYLRVKLDENELNNHNISVLITNDFLKAVKLDKNWQFEFGGLAHGDPVKARDIWNLIVENSINKGEPGILFEDNIKSNFASKYFEEFVSTNPCVTGDTNVITDKGVLSIKEIIDGGIENYKALSYNINTLELEWNDITFGGMTHENANIVELELENGNKLKLTPDHEVFTESRGYIKASQLTNEDVILYCVDIKNQEIIKQRIKKVNILQNEDVYDITVKNNHNFFANGILVSNCGEICLPDHGACCLGSINLANFYDEDKNDVQWSRLAKTIRIAVKFLDDVLTINNYPLPECKIAAEKSRRIGLGVMGLHYLLIKLGMKYGKKKSLEFIERLFATFRNESFEASIDLALEKGAFPAFNYEQYVDNNYIQQLPPRLLRKMKKQGIHNAAILTAPPTGTTSQLANVSSGIEPIFAPIHKRRYRTSQDKINEEIIVDSLLADHYHRNKSLAFFVSAYDVSPEEHIAVQAAIQQYIDGSIAKTINLPEKYTDVDDISDTIFGYSKHLKGMTMYRQNSRGKEPLTEIKFNGRKELGDYIEKAANIKVSEVNCASGNCDL